MVTKIQAAKLATESGTAVVIADGSVPDVLERLVQGGADRHALHSIGEPGRKPQALDHSGLASRGEVTVDNGAATALLRNGKSLLPAGITDVHGHFERGDTITIKDAGGKKLACGVANYGAADMAENPRPAFIRD